MNKENRFNILFTLLVSLIFLAGCASDVEKDSTSSDTKNESTSKETTKNKELMMGETAKLNTIIGDFNITLVHAEKKEEIDGRKPNREILISTEWKLKNTGEEALNIQDAIATIKLYNNTRASGIGWVLVGNQKEWAGKVEPGKTVSGKLIYDTENTDSYRANLYYVGDSDEETVDWKFKLD